MPLKTFFLCVNGVDLITVQNTIKGMLLLVGCLWGNKLTRGGLSWLTV